MPLDLHLGTSEQLAASSKVVCSFTNDLHAEIFSLDKTFGPFLARLSDFYKDAKFHLSEVSGLRKEISTLIERYDLSSDLAKFLNDLIRTLDEAVSSNLNAYFFCD